MNDSESNEEEFEEIDMNVLQDMMKDDGLFLNSISLSPLLARFMEMLIKTNDKAVQDIQSGNLKESLALLERMEKILEVI